MDQNIQTQREPMGLVVHLQREQLGTDRGKKVLVPRGRQQEQDLGPNWKESPLPGAQALQPITPWFGPQRHC